MNHSRRYGLALALGLIAFADTAMAQSVVVIAARGIALKPGARLDSSEALTLRQGQHVTLISVTGETIKLDGPFTGAPNGQGVAAAQRSALAALISERDARISSVGTVRGGVPLAPLPDPWLIDASHAGFACIREGTTPIFWRPDAAAEGSLAVMPDDRSWAVNAQWPMGVDRLTVNQGVRAGASYYVTFNGTESAIRVEEVPAALDNDSMRAAWMANKGCDAQATALVRNLK